MYFSNVILIPRQKNHFNFNCIPKINLWQIQLYKTNWKTEYSIVMAFLTQ